MESNVVTDYAKEIELLIKDLNLSSYASTATTSVQEAGSSTTPGPAALATTTPDPAALATTTPDPAALATTTPDPAALATTTPDPETCATTTPDPEACATSTPDPEACATDVSKYKMGRVLELVESHLMLASLQKIVESFYSFDRELAAPLIKSLTTYVRSVKTGNVCDNADKNIELCEILESEFKDYFGIVDPVLQNVLSEETSNLPSQYQQAVLDHILAVDLDIKSRIKILNLIKLYSEYIQIFLSRTAFVPESPQFDFVTRFTISLISLIEAIESIVDQLGKYEDDITLILERLIN